jgi:hypothetical protein
MHKPGFHLAYERAAYVDYIGIYTPSRRPFRNKKFIRGGAKKTLVLFLSVLFLISCDSDEGAQKTAENSSGKQPHPLEAYSNSNKNLRKRFRMR